MSIADRRSRAPGRSWLGRIFNGGGTPGVLRGSANSCCIVGVLVLVDRALPIDGLVTEIGAAAVTFRPASLYILDRHGAEVAVRFGDQDVRGRIIEVSARGYRVKLAAALDEAVVADVIEQFGMVA